MALTDARIRNLKPKEKPYKTADYDGLYVLTNPHGSKLWRFKYRLRGKEKLLSIGAYPEVSLIEARFARDEARKQLTQGIDPSESKREKVHQAKISDGCTFGSIAEQYVTKLTKEGRAEVTLRKLDWLIGMANADLGRRPIAEITSPMVLQTLKKTEAKGNYETARRLRSTIGAVFRYAIANGLAENDPTFALRDALITPKVRSRAAITDCRQLGGLMRAIDGFDGQATTRIALEFLALVVTRPGEVRYARWEEFDLENAVWTIPAERMKMRQPHKVPLSKRALVLLEQLHTLTGWGELLFPSIKSAHRPMSENTLNAALRRMGYTGDEMTAHGFRATFSTIANESGLWNPDAIERALAHVETNKIRGAYARGQYWDERVKIADWWSELLLNLR
ncbi:MAG: tyrosine-type recombinase/integrase [Rhizobiaceae bacterium]